MHYLYLLLFIVTTTQLNSATPPPSEDSESIETLEAHEDVRRNLLPAHNDNLATDTPRSCLAYCRKECCNKSACEELGKIICVGCCIATDVVALVIGVLYGCGLE